MIEQTVLPYEGQKYLDLVMHDGQVWIVRELLIEDGIVLAERFEPAARVVTTVPVEPEPEWRITPWAPGLVALVAVLIFLALVVGQVPRLTFADVLGVVLGFVWLVWLLDSKPYRRERRRLRRARARGYYPV